MEGVQPQPPQPPTQPPAQQPLPAQSPTVSFAEFKKLDLRVALVKSVEEHPNAQKLYVLKIDIGGEERQIVAGLKQYYTPEQLTGRRVVVICNLEPAMLRGVQSQGMMLAAQDGGRVMALQPDSDAAPGAKVS